MILKTIHFDPKHISYILSGKKTATIRFWRTSDVADNETVFFVDSKTGRPFATAKITSIINTTFSQIEKEDLVDSGHLGSFEQFRDEFIEYYHISISEDTPFLLLRFVIIDDGQFAQPPPAKKEKHASKRHDKKTTE